MATMSIGRRTFLRGAGLGAGALLVLPARGRAQQVTTEAVFDDPDQPVLGNRRGDVTIAEYFDYQCPFCKKDYPVVESFVKQDGNIRLVMKGWPIFGPASRRASQLVLGASDIGLYRVALNALMQTRGRLVDAQVDRVLADAGVDVESAQAAYRANKTHWDNLLARNAGQADALGLQGTPAFIIGTTSYPGVMDAAALRQAVATLRG